MGTPEKSILNVNTVPQTFSLRSTPAQTKSLCYNFGSTNESFQIQTFLSAQLAAYTATRCNALRHIPPRGFSTRSVLQQWKAEKSRLLKLQSDSHRATDAHITTEQKQKYNQWKRQWFQKIEKTLDTPQSGPLWLKDDQLAKEVADSMHYLDGKVYDLDAYCIMANHVHVVFAPLAIQSSVPQTFSLRNNNNDVQTQSFCYNTFSSIMQSLKGYTARKANQRLGRRGAFWHHESYDHTIRNESEWQRIVTYVLNNPVKAGLVDHWEKWRWNHYRAPHSTANSQVVE